MVEIIIKESIEEDYPYIKEWFENPENNVLFTSEFRNIKEYSKMFFLIALKKKSNKYFTIFVKEDTLKPVGFIALINIDHGDKFGQFWYVLGNKAYEGEGITSKALSLLLPICKNELGLHTVFTWVVEDNLGSIRVLEKNGFSKVGTQRQAYYYNGQFKNRVIYDKILEDYKEDNDIQKLRESIKNIKNTIEIDPSIDFIESGFLDSFDLINLVSKIEEKYCVKLKGEDLTPENFRNVESIFKLINTYRS